jgi:hypothetical protein
MPCGVAAGWEKFTGDAGRSISVEHCGASVSYERLYREFGITAEAVAAAARDSLYDVEDSARPGGHPAGFAPPADGTADRPAHGQAPYLPPHLEIPRPAEVGSMAPVDARRGDGCLGGSHGEADDRPAAPQRRRGLPVHRIPRR